MPARARCTYGGLLLACSAMSPLHRFITFAAIAIAAPVGAQQVGSTPPTLEFEKAWNDGPKTWADLDGKVVVLDFAQTW